MRQRYTSMSRRKGWGFRLLQARQALLLLASFAGDASAEPSSRPSACSVAAHVEPVVAPALEASLQISTANLRAWVSALAGPSLRGRAAGSADSRRSARLLAEYLRTLGAQPPSGSDHCRPFEVNGVRDQNVIGYLPPPGSARASNAGKWVVLGAHYDALGVDAQGRIYPGADDNATGVAILLEVARLLAARSANGGLAARPGVVFIAFGAEEEGLYGSAAYVAAPTIPLERVALMINVDMAGRLLAGNPGIGYEATGPERRSTVALVRRAASAAKVGVAPLHLGDRGDSASFSPYVPTVFFCTTVHADYHQPTDTAERVNYAQVTRAAELVLSLIEHVPATPAGPELR
jgi:aminopeptidase N